MSGVHENATLFKRLMKIHTNPPRLYYGFKNSKWKVYIHWNDESEGRKNVGNTHQDNVPGWPAASVVSPPSVLRHHLHRVVANFCWRSGHIAAINELSRGGRGGDICSQSMKRLGKWWMIINKYGFVLVFIAIFMHQHLNTKLIIHL